MHNVRVVILPSNQELYSFLKQSPNAHVLNIAPPINLDPKWLGSHVSYTSSRYLMGMITVGLSHELKDYQISVNALWPKTSIASTDICNVISGTYVDNMKTMRDPSIVADAAHAIVNRFGPESTGEQFIDEETLIDFKGDEAEDFDRYLINNTKRPSYF